MQLLVSILPRYLPTRSMISGTTYVVTYVLYLYIEDRKHYVGTYFYQFLATRYLCSTYVHIVPLDKVCLSPERVGFIRWIRPLRRSLRLDFIEVSKNILRFLIHKFQKWFQCNKLQQTLSVIML